MKFICFHVDHTGNRQWIKRDDIGGDDAYAVVPVFCIMVKDEQPL